MLITDLSETAWLFNLRGGDVDYNPVFVSYGIVSAKEATLFVDLVKVSGFTVKIQCDHTVASNQWR